MLTAPTPTPTLWRRLPQLFAGFVVMGTGIAMTVLARLGLSPWDVFHQGIADRTGLPIGTVGIVVGLVVLLTWIPMRERPGVGTVANAILIGLVVNVVLAVVDPPEALGLRVALLVGGIAMVGLGVGLYIGAGLGSGPRDGVMTGIARRGHPIWLVRSVMEASVFLAGWALGGTVGIGTLLAVLATGPIVHVSLHRFALDPITPEDDDPVLGPIGE